MSVAIITLNWNRADDTIECLTSVYKSAYTNYKVWVVDNASSDDSLSKIKVAFPQASYIENKHNLGFAEGNNVAIREAMREGFEYIYLINNDAVMHPDAIALVIEAAKNDQKAAVLGSCIYYYENPNKCWFAGADFDLKTKRFFLLNQKDIDTTALLNGKRSQNCCSVQPSTEIIETKTVHGCGMLVRCSSLAHTGLMDERFFLYNEETDWCMRIRSFGYRCLLVPNSLVWHKGCSSTGYNSPLYNYFVQRNSLLMLEKNINGNMFSNIFNRFFFDNLFMVFYQILSEKNSAKKKLAKAKLLGIRDYVLRRFGDCPKYLRTK